MKILLRLIFSALLAFPAIWFLYTNLHPFSGKILSEEKAHFLVAWEDFNGDGQEEVLISPNDEKKKEYFELWTDKNLAGLIRKDGSISKNSAFVADLDSDRVQDFLFVDCVNDSFFLNHFKMKMQNGKLNPSYKKYFLTVQLEKDYPYCFAKKAEDLNGDGKNEFIFIHSGGINARKLYVFDPSAGRIQTSELDFQLLTGFVTVEEPKTKAKKIIVSSYANGNIGPERTNLLASKLGWDTLLNRRYLSDQTAVVAELDKDLIPRKNIIKENGFTNMFRVLPYTGKEKSSYFALLTNLNNPDSLCFAYLLSDDLQNIQKKNIQLHIAVGRMTKYESEIVFNVSKGGEEHLFYAAESDTLFEINDSLNQSVFFVSPEINAGSKICELDADADGKNELFVSGRTGFFLFNETYAEPFFLSTERDPSNSADFHFAKDENGNRIVKFASRGGRIVSFSFSKNNLYPFRYLLFALAFLLVYILLWIYQKANERKLRKENERLEEIVKRRTEEIELKNKLLKSQKELVEEKQKEVLDSIHYAKRIQMSLMQSEKVIRNKLQKNISNSKQI